MQGIYAGIRIVEISRDMAGAFAGQICADRGAEVIKVEPLAGNALRHSDSYAEGESKLFQSLNRGKQSVALNLEGPAGPEVLARLAASADVIISDLDLTERARLKLDYDDARRANAQVIFVQVDYFGSVGEWALRPGNDLVMQAFSGMLASEGKREEDFTPRQIVSLRMAERSTGLAIALAIATGLLHRARTGQGQRIKTSQLKNLLALQPGRVSDNPPADERARGPRRDRILELRARNGRFEEFVTSASPENPVGANIFYRPYQTRDGAVFMGALSRGLRDKARKALNTDFMGRDDPDFDTKNPQHVAAARAELAEVVARFRERTTAEWIAIFDEAGVPAGAVVFPEDLSSEPQVLENGYVCVVEHETAGRQIQVSPAAQFSEFPDPPTVGSPTLGRDSKECLAALGYTAQEIEALLGM
jgi:crotonobetainyl-CoA:carnitine CoA-transferase CaiB-like acyl-CoA transferase